MTDDAAHKIERSIDKLTERFDNHIENFNKNIAEQGKAHDDIKNEYMELKRSLKESSDKVAPVIDMFSNLDSFQKVLVWFLKSALLIAAAITAVWGAIKLIAILAITNSK